MRIENRTRKTILGSHVKLVNDWWGRLRGFIGRPEPAPGEGMLLLPCDGVHTCGMRFDLDILFLDQNGKVLEVVPSLRPWRWTRRVRGARSVLEVPAGVIDGSETRVGDVLTWWDPAPDSPSGFIGSTSKWRSKPHSMGSGRGNQ